MINKYVDRLDKLISKYREIDLPQFEGPDGRSAKFDDPIWFYSNPKTGRRTRYLGGGHGLKGKGSRGTLTEDFLPYPYCHLIKIWIIHVVNVPISSSEQQARVSTARKLFSIMDGPLYQQTEGSLESLGLSDKSKYRLRSFLVFCADAGLMRPLELKVEESRDRSGSASLDNDLSKIPKTESIIALGAIFKEVFKNVEDDGSVRYGEQVEMLDALIVTFCLLCLASPNRMVAEVPLLPKQRLHSYAEAHGEDVYYLDWIGSKGFRNNRNHLLAALSKPIAKAANFFFLACEPARVLCRFYENPNQSLQVLLGELTVPAERARKVSMSKVPNIFVLGYALGFYDVNECVPVKVNLANSSPKKSVEPFELKPIYLLDDEDELSTAENKNTKTASLGPLFGYASFPKLLAPARRISVRKIQEWWLSYYTKKILPEFPLSFSKGESSLMLKDAMFCFLGNWCYGLKGVSNGGAKRLQRSRYAVVPLASLGKAALNRLSGWQGGGISLFERYGFSTDLAFKAHSLRHLCNTLADLSSIPVEVITAWSGRKNSDQTHTYIHTSHDEKARRVSAIINAQQPDRESIRIVVVEKISEVTNLPASITSTGICTQDLNVSPCDYLNGFITQCFMCPETCHVAGDEKAIEFLATDLSFQSARLESVERDPRLANSQAMGAWYVIHSRNQRILTQLIELMKTETVGSLIRYSSERSEFCITDLNTRGSHIILCALPDATGRLKEIVDKSSALGSAVNPELQNLLSMFGISGGEA